MSRLAVATIIASLLLAGSTASAIARPQDDAMTIGATLAIRNTLPYPCRAEIVALRSTWAGFNGSSGAVYVVDTCSGTKVYATQFTPASVAADGQEEFEAHELTDESAKLSRSSGL